MLGAPSELIVKREYLKELEAPADILKRGSKSDDVKRLQEWLVYWTLVERAQGDVIKFDGVFGPKTEARLKHVQGFLNQPETGVVNGEVWDALVAPMREAFSLEAKGFLSLRERMTYFASRHLQFCSCELLEDNIGPWVRSYMQGRDGTVWFWCEGFATTILDQTYSSFEVRFTEYYLNTVSTEEMRESANKNGLLVDNKTLCAGGYQPQPGDMVLFIDLEKQRAHHTAIIYDVYGDSGAIRVIGGNTNFVGTDNGVGVFFVDSNYMQEPIEVVKLTPISR